jgi:hypothetical protein
MKFYKRQNLDYHNPMDDTLAATADGRIIADTNKSLRVPSGTSLQRPTDTSKGQIRDNTTIFEIDVKEGDILIIPSMIKHRSPIVENNIRKTIISFNASVVCDNSR